MSRQKLVHISSRDRVSPLISTSTKFTVNLGFETLSDVKHIALKEVELTNAFYNIDTYNNTFYFHSSGEKSIVVPRGQYTITQLISKIQTELAGQGITATITLVANTNVLSWNVNVAMRFYEYRLDGTRNPMAYVLGIRGDTGSEVLNTIATGIPDLSGVKSLFLCSSTLSPGGITSSGGGSAIALTDVIPVEAGFLETIYSRNSDSESDNHVYDRNLRNNISTVSFELRDSMGNLLDNNGHDISIVLKVYY